MLGAMPTHHAFSPAAWREAALWIINAGLAERSASELVEGTVKHLREGGVRLYRINIAFRILHPLFDGMSFTWTEEKGIDVSFNSHLDAEGSIFRLSPFYHMLLNGLTEYRCRLDDANVARFPMLADLRAMGITDYLAMIVPFGDAPPSVTTRDGIGTSWATRAPEGFDQDELAAIRWLLRPLALALRVAIKDQITRTALDTFHGPLVGGRILSGAIKRGAGERLSAALWYSDLRNSTGLADAMPIDNFLALLNAYFECAAGAVMQRGGQVLDIIGDAILAVFPAESDDDRQACTEALASAADAVARLGAMRREGLALADTIRFGIGVHFGDVVFGNAGTPERLKFGVIGRAVNEVVRTASMSKSLERPVIASDEVARRTEASLDDLGLHDLRGIATARRLWGLAPPAA